MILDTLESAARYAPVHPGFAPAFAFLRRPDLAQLADGRYEIDGDRVFALVQSGSGRGRAGARLEAHRRYIDIQFTVAGIEQIGWESLNTCRARAQGYDAARDVEFFTGEPVVWTALVPGMYAIYFPDDAHAPLAGSGSVRKVVVKVAV
jgi:YhcH/YjgK/YiaL family protein